MKKRLKKCLGILQIIYALFMSAIGIIGVVLMGASYHFYENPLKLILFVYSLVSIVFSVALFFFGVGVANDDVIPDDMDEYAPRLKHNHFSEWAIIILNVLFLLFSAGVSTFFRFALPSILYFPLFFLLPILMIVLALFCLGENKK